MKMFNPKFNWLNGNYDYDYCYNVSLNYDNHLPEQYDHTMKCPICNINLKARNFDKGPNFQYPFIKDNDHLCYFETEYDALRTNKYKLKHLTIGFTSNSVYEKDTLQRSQADQYIVEYNGKAHFKIFKQDHPDTVIIPKGEAEIQDFLISKYEEYKLLRDKYDRLKHFI